MTHLPYVATVSILMCSAVIAGDINVTWKKDGASFVNENRLPPGATVKIRVVTLNDRKESQQFTVNGEKLTAKAVGDEFRAKVDQNGKVRVQWFGVLDAAVGNELRFGIHNTDKAARWHLAVQVRVMD